MSARKLMVFLLLPTFAWGQDDEHGDRHPLFQTDVVLKAVLTAPLSQAYAQRHQDVRIYLPGQWTYIDENGDTQRLEVSVRTRGHFRRETCQQPPLQLNFKKSQVKGTHFKGQNKLKLVAPCKEGERYQQYVILEYLAYRILQQLTDHSFSTRLVRLSYVDRDEKLDPWTDIAFLIEDDADLSDRLGLKRLNLDIVRYSQLDHPRVAIAQMFQFLIANNDYSFVKSTAGDECCHNVQMIGFEDDDNSVADGDAIPVPYDFDFSGLVNANYANPPSQIPIRDVRERYFYGLCQPKPIFDEAIAHFQRHREAILDLFRTTPELDEKFAEHSIEYVEEFYEILDDPELFAEEVVARCRGVTLMDRHFGTVTD